MYLLPLRWTTLAVLCVASISSTAIAGPYDELAAKIAAILNQTGEKSVIVGNFAGPPLSDGGGGAIGRELADVLKAKHQIAVEPSAKFAITGSYSITPNNNDRLQIEVEVDIKNSKTNKRLSNAAGVVNKEEKADAPSTDNPPAGKPVVTIAAKDLGDTQLMALVATSCEFSGKMNGKEREQLIAQSLDKGPRPYIGQQNEVRAKSTSPYGLAVFLVGEAGKLRSVRPTLDAQGHATIDLKIGDRYVLRLFNDSEYEAAANVTVDGVSVFAFSGQPRSQFLVASGKSTEVKGWVKDNEKGNRFEITRNTPELEKLFGAGDQSNVGAITVSFSASWKNGEKPPADESTLVARGVDGLRTTLGEPTEQTITQVPREIGNVRSTVTIRYSK